MSDSMKKYVAEFLGTLILVLFGTGVAVISGGNIVGTALAFGLAIVAGAYTIGNISGCHVNPAVSFAFLLNGKMSIKEFFGYVVSQILGALAGSGILYAILKLSEIGTETLGTNGYGELSSANITLLGALIVEVILTFIFIYIILCVTSDSKKENVAGIIIGLTLMFVHLFGIILTGTSVNPARSLAPALIQGGTALSQVWVFIVAPLVGSALATYTFKFLNQTKKTKK